ncbi:hypothetical protein AKJ64_02455 [candidate division MSBL1 archaeon SCGC-AAA259E17]|uniref:Uroporphyrinogen decarboxylase (URO-D) domain-containing protein n=1 Tax=candidate division MSBL1 archaeon SCGC-AAA259E17 TaxID=1698263 RepID=A0A133UEP8_9EURY|nr:hypothetical protein AKJ64_02455 [candidate division MSBL1 archaeon SCGC-AAA259E17]
MNLMSKKDRVRRAINFEKIDRVPVYDKLRQPEVIEHYAGKKLNTEMTREKKQKIVTRAIKNSLDATAAIKIPEKARTVEDDEGFVREIKEFTTWIKSRPFDDLSDAITYVEQKVEEENSMQGDGEELVREETLRYLDMLEDVSLVIGFPVGLDIARNTLGPDLFYRLYHENPNLISEWLDILLEKTIESVQSWKKIAEKRDKSLNELFPVVSPFSDIAHNKSTMASPQFLREEFFWRLEKLVKILHENKMNCMFHSDGNLEKILPDLVSTGIDALNPLDFLVDPYADMGFKEIRERYPDLALVGGINIRGILTKGTPKEVKDEVRRIVDITEGKGIIIGSTTELRGVPQKNAIAMIETAKRMKL